MHPARVEVRRGSIVESSHRVHVAVCDGAGNLVNRAGDADLVTFTRSSAKPFQALPLVTTGAADAFGLTSEELALACASHVGEPKHVALATRMLARGGVDASLLACGTHAPRSPRAERTPLHHNCSGKHAGMMLLEKHLGGDPALYWTPESAAQRAVAAALREVAGIEPAVGVDGCGVPNFALPLRAAATMAARLAMPQGVSKETSDALGRIARAMAQHPDLVGGAGAFDTDLMGASEDRLVAKGGAEGFQLVADLASGMGLALKIEDGDHAKRATASATVEALRQLAWLEGRAFEVLGEWWMPPVRNFSGRVVGEVRPVLALERA